VLGQREQEQVERAEREPDQQVLQRMQAYAGDLLPREERQERERDEEQRVFDRALAALVDVDGLSSTLPRPPRPRSTAAGMGG